MRSVCISTIEVSLRFLLHLGLTSVENGVGSILFGGIDTNKYTGPLVSLPIQADTHTKSIISFTVAMDNLRVVDAAGEVPYSKTNMQTPVIFDSGTTITYLPDEMAHRLYVGVGAVNSMAYGVVAPCDVANSNATIEFGFGNPNGPKIVAAISQFILPFPADMPAPSIRGSSSATCRWGIQASAGRPNLFGDTFLRGAYLVYNLDGNEVAIAQAKVNNTEPNIVEITSKKLPGVTSTASGSVRSNTAIGNIGPNTILGKPPNHMSSQITAGQTGTFNLGPTNGPGSGGGGHKLFGGRKSAGDMTMAPSVKVMMALAVFVGTIGGGVTLIARI
jgi:hypothetical protein